MEEETGIGHCNYEFKLYPSKKLEGDTEDNLPLIATVVSAAVFMAIAIAFLVYDSFVAKRNKMIVDAAAKSNAIVLSLFPAHVRDKLLKARDWGNVSKPKKNNGINDLLDTDNSEGGDAFPVAASETIAELFPSASGEYLLQSLIPYNPTSDPIICSPFSRGPPDSLVWYVP